MKILLKHLFMSLFFIVGSYSNTIAQDTLPRISVKSISNKVIVSWRSTYGARITAINIQRSSDSIKNFTSIGSVLEPNNRENGFVDSKAPSPNMFYRVFVAFAGGSYIFTKSYRAQPDTGSTVVAIPEMAPTPQNVPEVPTGFVASRHIYTGKDNNVIIDLPGAATSKYSIQFFDDDDKPVFEINKVSEPFLIIEKVNFHRSGWFYFKLFENGVIKERHEIYIPKEGKYGIPPEEIKKRYR